MNFSQALPRLLSVAVLLAAAPAGSAPLSKDNPRLTTSEPQYVFFFLGDGMANSQIQAAEAYLTTRHGGSATLATDLLAPENRLNMTKMPVAGMQTTYDASALMTDSASAGTAFACGLKTKSGVIGMDQTQTLSYKSIAQLAHEHGSKVGVLTSVSLDHATPAAYYASVSSRNYMNNIATQLAESGYELFGGGGFASPTGPKRDGDTSRNIWDHLTANGYQVLNDRASILELKDGLKGKFVAINQTLDRSSAMPYAIDRTSENLSLAEMTDVATQFLYRLGESSGFFLMVEGGKIDWACHANDAVAAIGDVLDFDQAIRVALDFYDQHPTNTLIVVTGDHETGGMTIGHATTAYTAHYDKLMGQTGSFDNFAENQWKAHKAANEAGYDWTRPDNLASSSAMLGLMREVFGLDWSELNEYQQKKLEDAYDQSMIGSNDNSRPENSYLYGSYEPIVVTITHVLNENASVGWTSYSHTGVPVPIYAKGEQAQRFSGFYDNTDIPKRLAKAMGLSVTLPATR